MSNNVQAEQVSSAGSRFITAEVTAYGDASTHIPGSFQVIVSGSEGAQTFAEIVGGAGAVAAGVQRVTLASDDPAVATLGGVSDAAATQGSTGSISAKLRTVTSQLNTIASTGIPITGTVTVGSHAVTNAGTFAVQVDGSALTALQLIDDAIYADNGAWDDGSKHILVGGVYQSSPHTVFDNTVSPILLDSNGRVQAACTNVGTFAVQVDGSALTSLQLIDDIVVTLGTSTYSETSTKGAVIGAVRRDADTTLVDTTNEIGPLQMNAAGQLKVEVFSGETLPVSVTSTTITGTVAVTQSGTWDEVGINDSGNSITVDAPVGTPVFVRLSDGSSAITTLPVSLASVPSHAVTNAGTFAVQVDNTVSVIGTLEVGGETAHDAAIGGSVPVLIGFEAKDFDGSALPNVVNAEANAVRAAASLYGVQYVMVVNENGSAVGTVNATCTNAGTFAVQVDGSALTALQLIDDTVVTLGTDTYTEATSKGLTIGAVRRDADTTLVNTTNEWGPLQMDANGRLKVEAFSGETLPVSMTSTTVTGTVAVTQSGTWDEVGIHDSGNSITVDYATTGSGTATGALRVELPTNGTGVIATVGAVTAITNALPAGTNAIGKLAANSGVDIGDVDVTSISAGTNLIGNVGIGVRTSGGMSIFRSIDIDESEEEIKASAGQVYSIAAFNRTAAPLYLKFYNATAANVTVGSTTPVLTFVVPGNGDSDGAGFLWDNPIGFAFGTAITVACTTGVADADTGAPGANDCVVNVGYA